MDIFVQKHSTFKLNKIRKTPICNLIYNFPKQKDETYLNKHYSKKTNERIYLRNAVMSSGQAWRNTKPEQIREYYWSGKRRRRRKKKKPDDAYLLCRNM